MELFFQRALDGVGNGGVYSAMAIGIVLVFISTGTLNLALGAMGMFCTMFAWWLVSGSGWGVAFPLALLAAVVLACVGGAVLERVFVRPVEDERDHLSVVIVTLGLLLALQSLAGGLFTVDVVSLPVIFPEGSLDISGVRVAYDTIGLVGTVLVMGGGLYFLFQKTRLGLAMRAAVDNPLSSRLSGVRRSQMLMLGWGLAGGLGAIAGILVAPTTLVHTGMLDNALFLGFAAAALGGLNSPFGALVGGLLMGLIESLAPAYIPFLDRQLALLTAFAIMLAVLLFRPTGIFGTSETTRV